MIDADGRQRDDREGGGGREAEIDDRHREPARYPDPTERSHHRVQQQGDQPGHDEEENGKGERVRQSPAKQQQQRQADELNPARDRDSGRPVGHRRDRSVPAADVVRELRNTTDRCRRAGRSRAPPDLIAAHPSGTVDLMPHRANARRHRQRARRREPVRHPRRPKRTYWQAAAGLTATIVALVLVAQRLDWRTTSLAPGNYARCGRPVGLERAADSDRRRKSGRPLDQAPDRAQPGDRDRLPLLARHRRSLARGNASERRLADTPLP